MPSLKLGQDLSLLHKPRGERLHQVRLARPITRPRTVEFAGQIIGSVLPAGVLFLDNPRVLATP